MKWIYNNNNNHPAKTAEKKKKYKYIIILRIVHCLLHFINFQNEQKATTTSEQKEKKVVSFHVLVCCFVSRLLLRSLLRLYAAFEMVGWYVCARARSLTHSLVRWCVRQRWRRRLQKISTLLCVRAILLTNWMQKFVVSSVVAHTHVCCCANRSCSFTTHKLIRLVVLYIRDGKYNVHMQINHRHSFYFARTLIQLSISWYCRISCFKEIAFLIFFLPIRLFSSTFINLNT